MKPKTLIWIIILLLIMNVSAVVTMLYHNNQENKAEISKSYETAVQSGTSMQYSGRWFRDELGLTGDQMRDFSQFNPAFRQKMRDINIELSEKRKKMLDELAAEKSDTTLLNEISDSIGQLHSKLKKATYAYYLEFKKICTPEQQEKLNSIFTSMFEGENPSMGPGKGMQGGRRFGMRWRNNQETTK